MNIKSAKKLLQPVTSAIQLTSVDLNSIIIENSNYISVKFHSAAEDEVTITLALTVHISGRVRQEYIPKRYEMEYSL